MGGTDRTEVRVGEEWMGKVGGSGKGVASEEEVCRTEVVSEEELGRADRTKV